MTDNDHAEILVVDDELGPRESLRMILKDRYRVATATDGRAALDVIGRDEPDMVLLDLKMPDMDGIEVLERLRAMDSEAEVAIVTAYATLDTARAALRLGAIDYLIKPFQRDEVEAVVRKGLDRRKVRRELRDRFARLELANESLVSEVERATDAIRSHYEETVRALTLALDAKDHYTAEHSVVVATLTVELAEALDFQPDEIALLRQAALVHDLGKIGVDEAVLKKRGLLTPYELRQMQKHPVVGAEIIGAAAFMRGAIPAVRHHHEHPDGSGYPDQLPLRRIPFEARVIAVADAIHAMLSDRPYRGPMPAEAVIAELKRQSGTQFDSEVIEVAIELGLPHVVGRLQKRPPEPG